MKHSDLELGALGRRMVPLSNGSDMNLIWRASNMNFKLNPFAAIANGGGDDGGAFAKPHPFQALADKEFSSGSSFWGASRGNSGHPAALQKNGSWSNSRGRGDAFLKSNGSVQSGFGKLNVLSMALSARSSENRDSIPLLSSRKSEGNKKAS